MCTLHASVCVSVVSVPVSWISVDLVCERSSRSVLPVWALVRFVCLRVPSVCTPSFTAGSAYVVDISVSPRQRRSFIHIVLTIRACILASTSVFYMCLKSEHVVVSDIRSGVCVP